ncbi:GAF domain-containing protein [Tsukamurella asaccharolytica]|uniref:GAF domain-containing protein n=1 Tax=Tsukamurella asaccharolytica TaxID=2592067 RepID=A0A5C5R9G2_9ACTN|nr:GAF domain-containing protein [Tsukamurella asaccharolytica]TWS18831.1 GAF domain-containing protein [Tsukamurella asaccharolytica]
MTSRPDTTRGLGPVADELARVATDFRVKSVLVMRSDAESMVVAGTAGEAAHTYVVGGAGAKALGAPGRVPLYCERVVDGDEAVYVRDSRADAVFAGNEDETEYGLINYLGLPVHDADGAVVGTVCVLDDTAREYGEDQRRELARLRDSVESLLREDPDALS